MCQSVKCIVFAASIVLAENHTLKRLRQVTWAASSLGWLKRCRYNYCVENKIALIAQSKMIDDLIATFSDDGEIVFSLKAIRSDKVLSIALQKKLANIWMMETRGNGMRRSGKTFVKVWKRSVRSFVHEALTEQMS